MGVALYRLCKSEQIIELWEHSNRIWTPRWNRNESFLERKKIRGGWFTGLGACIEPNVSLYDHKTKKYRTRQFRGAFEVLNVTGNIAKKGKETIIHEHITMSGEDYRAHGGHLNRMTIGATLELFLKVLPPLKRAKDNSTGLNLLKES